MRSTLVVLSGPAGAGKSSALRLAASLGVVVFQKRSTRLPRTDEVLRGCPDTAFLSPEEFAVCKRDPDFWRFSDECEWAFNVQELRALTSLHPMVCCSMHVPAVIPRLQAALAGVDVVGVLVYADEAVRQARIVNDCSPLERSARANCAPPMLARYQQAPLAYRHVILNIFDQATFEQHVRELFEYYRHEGEHRADSWQPMPAPYSLQQPLVVAASAA